LIAQTRRPVAPLNGLVTLLPHNLILCDRSEGAGLREAVRRDVSTAVRCLRLRFPAYVVISGWEGDEGFHELVRRLGPDIPAAKRFGKGAELWAAPLPSRLEAVCMHACGAFEDWIYHLFRQSDSTKRTTNRALFGLLCKIRRYLRPRLLNLIPDGCGCDEEGKHVQEASLFGGCYFVAAGREPGSQAFAAGIFQRMLGEQQELEWTPPALRADELHWRVAWVGFAASLGFIILTIVAAYLQFRGGAP
jgi:hypothetical protein